MSKFLLAIRVGVPYLTLIYRFRSGHIPLSWTVKVDQLDNQFYQSAASSRRLNSGSRRKYTVVIVDGDYAACEVSQKIFFKLFQFLEYHCNRQAS